MSSVAEGFICHGCGHRVNPIETLPFRCPNADADDIDHLLLPVDAVPSFTALQDDNPYLRYRGLLSPYRLARRAGLSDDAWAEFVGKLDEALIEADGAGFRVTPMAENPELAKGVGFFGTLWVKDETGNVSGSHKARHLMNVMLYLRVIAAAKLPVADGLNGRRLAIASCGNAALAAAVIARAADWPLDVFIPPDASSVVVRRLQELGARITVCQRRQGEAGDPCFLRFLEAVRSGAIPFGVQGSESGLAVEGARTLAFEMAEGFAAAKQSPDVLYVQVGGGALASALAQGFALAVAGGLIAASPQLMAVQTAACAPLDRAWRRMMGINPDEAARHRSRFMWPWEHVPQSIAHGILDDETYDWLEIITAMRATGGQPLVVDEVTLVQAHDYGRRLSGIRASATGTAGLAGLLADPSTAGCAAVIFSGVER